MRRIHWLSLISLLLAGAALLGAGALRARDNFLTRGMPGGLPQPVAHAGPRPGLNVYLGQYNDRELEEALAAIAATGVSAVKQSYYYSEVFEWAEVERQITAVSRHDLTLIPLLDGRPADGFAPIPPDQFAVWAGEFAARFGSEVRHYIIWDEPNITSHWGDQPVDPYEYAAILSAAAAAVRAADGDAVIVAAPLAPTVETGPMNLADPIYMQRLYEAGAGTTFDAAAAKPYGFDHAPDDRRVDVNILNFSRAILLREVMVANGDGDKALWAGNWGWNALPATWSGSDSIWGKVTPSVQAAWTVAGWQRAQQEWPWMGFMFLENWEPDAPASDPRWGFRIAGRETADRLALALAARNGLASTGFHLARPGDPAQRWAGEWRFSPEFGADVGQHPDDQLSGGSVSITFWGTDLGLRVRRAGYRARFYITVDGQPANALPQDENGAVLVLTAPDPAEDYINIVPVARGLDPGKHVAEIVASRGWDQWALNGFSVGYRPPTTSERLQWTLLGAALLGVLGGGYGLWQGRRAIFQKRRWLRWQQKFRGLQMRTQLLLVGLSAALVSFSGWQLWWGPAAGVYRRLDHSWQLALLGTTALIFYVTPYLPVYLAALTVLVLLISFRPAWGLALITLAMPLYARQGLFKEIAGYHFSPTEIFIWVTLAAFLLHKFITALPEGRRTRPLPGAILPLATAVSGTFALFILEQLNLLGSAWGLLLLQPLLLGLLLRATVTNIRRADMAVLLFVSVATLSLFFTERLDVARNEWWLLIIEPSIFYLLFRAVHPTVRERWVVLDAFVLSGLVVAGYGLWQYGFDRQSLITAEGGLRRLRSFYGSPNNVALYLDRLLPLLAALGLWGIISPRLASIKIPSLWQKRRWLYAAALLPAGLALVLTFSRGGLVLGIPAGLITVGWLWLRRQERSPWPWAVGLVVLGAATFLVAQQIPQLAARMDLTGATGAFRINLWRASLEMIREQPVWGVGLDNFLYAYRGRYIFDAAWQEPNLNHPHNLVLDFATRLGLVGLACGSWLFWQLLRALRRAWIGSAPVWQPVLAGFAGTLAAMVAHGLVDHVFFLVDLALIFYLALGTAVLLDQTN